ncbi:MAG: hypothetical protein KGQ41_05060, partial [Alphaproteobacteria bacterium]|nr:hypothetical protein [Alphaproteobacteria bacterium]
MPTSKPKVLAAALLFTFNAAVFSAVAQSPETQEAIKAYTAKSGDDPDFVVVLDDYIGPATHDKFIERIEELVKRDRTKKIVFWIDSKGGRLMEGKLMATKLAFIPNKVD